MCACGVRRARAHACASGVRPRRRLIVTSTWSVAVSTWPIMNCVCVCVGACVWTCACACMCACGRTCVWCVPERARVVVMCVTRIHASTHASTHARTDTRTDTLSHTIVYRQIHKRGWVAQLPCASGRPARILVHVCLQAIRRHARLGVVRASLARACSLPLSSVARICRDTTIRVFRCASVRVQVCVCSAPAPQSAKSQITHFSRRDFLSVSYSVNIYIGGG